MMMVREMDYELDHDLPDVACLRCTGRGQERPSITELRLPQVALLELQLKKSLPAMQQGIKQQTSDKGGKIRHGKGRAQLRKERCSSHLSREGSTSTLGSISTVNRSEMTSPFTASTSGEDCNTSLGSSPVYNLYSSGVNDEFIDWENLQDEVQQIILQTSFTESDRNSENGGIRGTNSNDDENYIHRKIGSPIEQPIPEQDVTLANYCESEPDVVSVHSGDEETVANLTDAGPENQSITSQENESVCGSDVDIKEDQISSRQDDVCQQKSQKDPTVSVNSVEDCETFQQNDPVTSDESENAAIDHAEHDLLGQETSTDQQVDEVTASEDSSLQELNTTFDWSNGNLLEK